MNSKAKYLTQGGQMTAYRWRMFIQVNNWIGYWVMLLFCLLTAGIFFFRIPKETLDNGLLYWFASLNSSFTLLMPAGAGKFYDISYWYAPTGTTYHLKMTLGQILSDAYMQAMGAQLLDFLKLSAVASGVFSVVVYCGVVWYVTRLGKKESEDEFISGMTLTDKPQEVNRLLRKNGELSDLRIGDLHMVLNAEVMNFLIHGTIGVGKSTIIRWLMDYIRKRGDRAIIYDSGCTFIETHYRPEKDVILDPFDERCPWWDMWGECRDSADYQNLATSLIPEEGESDPFWVASSRTIYADLAVRMSTDPDRSIEKFLKTLLSLSMKSLREYLANTPAANLVEEKIEKTAISIRSVVTNYAKSLRYLQGLKEKGGKPFTIRNWMTSPEHDSSWLFIASQARHRSSIRPLISMWVSLATLWLQSMGEDADRRVWFILDEIPNLQRIPDLPGTLAEGRKFGGCFVIGAQNMPQLISVYGQQLAKSIFDLVNTRVYGRSPSSEVAEMVEKELGHQRRREAREQNSYGLDQVRDGVSVGKDKVKEPIADYEKIMTLPNLSFYVRLPGEYPVTRLKLKYRPFKKNHPGLIERDFHDVLSPELEKLVERNEREARAAGIKFTEPVQPDASATEGPGAATPKPADSTEPVTPPAQRPAPKAATASPVSPPASGTPVTAPAAPAVRPSASSAPAGAAPGTGDRSRSRASAGESLQTERASTSAGNVVPLHRTRVSPDVVTAVIPAPSQGTQPGSSVTPSARPTASPAVSPVTKPATAIPAATLKSAPAASQVIPGSALNLLDKYARSASRKTADSTDEEAATESGGDSPSLDMKMETLPGGGLQLTTAGKSSVATHADQPGQDANQRLQEDEQTILRHRRPDHDDDYQKYLSQQDEMEHDL